MVNKVQEYSETKQKVNFKIKVIIDENGICKALCSIRNTNVLSKFKASIQIRIYQDDQILLELSSEPTVIYGTLTSRLDSNKKSILTHDLYGRIDLSDVDITDTSLVDKALQSLDKDIAIVANKLRKAKILKSSDIDSLSKLLDKLKIKRAEGWNMMVYQLKFKMLSIQIETELV